MFDRINYAMIVVSDMNRSVTFYRDQLGFKLRFQSEEWTEFETGDTTLALHLTPKPPLSGTERRKLTDRRKSAAGTVTLGLNVTNLDQAVADLKGRGVQFVMEPTLRQKEGIRLAVFVDPDGCHITIAEHTK